MKHSMALRAVTAADPGDGEPSTADLGAIEREMPLILAEVELLDAQITTLDRTPTELDARRLRRARRKVLAARRALANHAAGMTLSGGAA
ncbi:hypothetical protein GCM10010420_55620 [Streptomyces glaucosporus]|uniref:DUF465 domain-containing protein n=1 Tax=Streptomyces glaucosporus TaxID=284044 RepID=A0ABP5W5W4_9ACTN